MKLVFFDEMPASPISCPRSINRLSQWVSQGRELAAKASDRASLTIKKKLSKQNVSAPFVITRTDHALSHEQYFRPLELSIYLPGNRLSDLPGFECIDFTVTGELQVPPKALLRARSENTLQPITKMTRRPAVSMVGERQLDYWQQRQLSLISTRPPSACEGLSSHPVYWTSLPGLPSQCEIIRRLSPMAEEDETSPVLRQDIGSMCLSFPPVEDEVERQASPAPDAASLPPASIQVPYRKPQRPDAARLRSSNCTRISQWLSYPFPSARTTSLDVQKSQFYQCAISPPLREHLNGYSGSRSRGFSASTVGSNVGSLTESLASMTSLTTAQTVYSPRSRSDTLRSCGRRVTVVEGEGLPDVPDLYAHDRDTESGKMPVAVFVGEGMAF